MFDLYRVRNAETMKLSRKIDYLRHHHLVGYKNKRFIRFEIGLYVIEKALSRSTDNLFLIPLEINMIINMTKNKICAAKYFASLGAFYLKFFSFICHQEF